MGHLSPGTTGLRQDDIWGAWQDNIWGSWQEICSVVCRHSSCHCFFCQLIDDLHYILQREGWHITNDKSKPVDTKTLAKYPSRWETLQHQHSLATQPVPVDASSGIEAFQRLPFLPALLVQERCTARHSPEWVTAAGQPRVRPSEQRAAGGIAHNAETFTYLKGIAIARSLTSFQLACLTAGLFSALPHWTCLSHITLSSASSCRQHQRFEKPHCYRSGLAPGRVS